MGRRGDTERGGVQITNPKFQVISNDRNSKLKMFGLGHLVIENWDLFGICLPVGRDIAIWDLSTEIKSEVGNIWTTISRT
jgi:hypothetical protein